MTKMNPEIKAQWVQALRSGKYKQGEGRLRSGDDKYCCLGVLTDLAVKAGVRKWKQVDFMRHAVDGNSSTLAGSVQEWSGLHSENPIILEGMSLAELNDGNQCNPHSFGEIADLIEEYL